MDLGIAKVVNTHHLAKLHSVVKKKSNRFKSEFFAPISNPKIINWLKEEEGDPKCNKYIKRG